ncbi:hypothetical protein Rvan_0510 [Rhodomicrobium vannielii ATCC 17100]|jgi:hypothetical protein|uniref:Uncharacterized protein n=1 Tax=Rhodomicrobium vannielii (strain ATCC 17100 / DSM 162 / LMG 4299 / NCIMB 10020 / ATH 3.1.1) TaxID=648757 RepID=E3HYQ1_RHOVT|nr:hypothetical protein [Rhodomicrobium vannielii]ADP69792.1 hypothetical protein Rvan_0510 [Rhodomicrobium vannielii ATCC 17100]
MNTETLERLSPTQLYHRVLLDIATAAAASALGTSTNGAARATEESYVPGRLRESLLAECDEGMRRRLSSLANSAVAALAMQGPDNLAQSARKHGIDLSAEEALQISEHFEAKRNAVLSYQRGRELS